MLPDSNKYGAGSAQKQLGIYTYWPVLFNYHTWLKKNNVIKLLFLIFKKFLGRPRFRSVKWIYSACVCLRMLHNEIRNSDVNLTNHSLKIPLNNTSDGMLGISAWPRSFYIYPDQYISECKWSLSPAPDKTQSTPRAQRPTLRQATLHFVNSGTIHARHGIGCDFVLFLYFEWILCCLFKW